MSTKKAEIYSGGSARGALQVYSAEQLESLHGFFDVEIHGGSTGSITAAGRGTGKLDVVRRIYQELKGSRSFQSLQIDIWRGLYSLRPLMKLIEENLHPGDFHCPTYAHMVDLADNKYEAIPLHKLSTRSELAEAIAASCCQFGIHEGVKFRERWKGDAGIHAVTPKISMRNIDTAYYISCAPLTTMDRYIKIDPERMPIDRGLDLIVHETKRRDYQRMKKQAASGKKVWLIEPQEEPGSPFDAGKKIIKRRLEVIGPEAWDARILL